MDPGNLLNETEGSFNKDGQQVRRLSASASLQNLESSASEVLQVQLKVFYENRDDDSDEFAQRFDNVRLELDDLNECFELVKNMVMDTPAEPYFLSIFQVRQDTVQGVQLDFGYSFWTFALRMTTLKSRQST